MFKDCSIMVLAAGVEEECEIYNLDINSDTQKKFVKPLKFSGTTNRKQIKSHF